MEKPKNRHFDGLTSTYQKVVSGLLRSLFVQETNVGQGRPGIKFLTAEEVHALQDSGEIGKYNFIDVRTRVEFDRCHLEGASLRPLAEIGTWSKELEHDRSAILYCQKGVRCMQAAQYLLQVGFTDVSVLGGGVDAYQAHLRTKRP
ncbi:MAG: molybdopterin biosynthesis-like protein MoeZ [Methanomassiliicoccales archaeon PtaU1.Bin124]|nr:MAG: molybdopterin biosynthesis-like protein MoeZ [Methanomassiliicoccales archaeon PtaU1.Bin124]